MEDQVTHVREFLLSFLFVTKVQLLSGCGIHSGSGCCIRSRSGCCIHSLTFLNLWSFTSIIVVVTTILFVESQGQVESGVKVVKRALEAAVQQKVLEKRIDPRRALTWCDSLKEITHTLINTPKHNWGGVTPYQAHTGKKDLRAETLNPAHAELLESVREPEVSVSSCIWQ